MYITQSIANKEISDISRPCFDQGGNSNPLWDLSYGLKAVARPSRTTRTRRSKVCLRFVSHWHVFLKTSQLIEDSEHNDNENEGSQLPNTMNSC